MKVCNSIPHKLRTFLFLDVKIMNEENKTVTLPLSEYRRMEEIVAQREVRKEETEKMLAERERNTQGGRG